MILRGCLRGMRLGCLVFFGWIVATGCGDDGNGKISLRRFSTDSIFTPRLQPILLNAYAEERIKSWTQFEKVRQSINLMGLVESLAREKSLSDTEASLNNTYQALYYQVSALYENIIDMERNYSSDYFKTQSLRSRFQLFKTYVLYLKSEMEDTVSLTNDDVIKHVEDIFSSYNGFVSEIGREYNDKLEDPALKEIMPSEGATAGVNPVN